MTEIPDFLCTLSSLLRILSALEDIALKATQVFTYKYIKIYSL